MTILQSLDRYYDRLAARGEAEDFGFTREYISYALAINGDGSVRDVFDLRIASGRTIRPTRISVPRPKRTSNIQSNFLWDKTAYAFGVDGGKSKRLSDEHEEFKSFHFRLLADLEEPHAKAILAFMERWSPDSFDKLPFSREMVDASFVFRLEDERMYLHDVPILRERWLSTFESAAPRKIFCLVSGRQGELETGHPIIKGVEGAQTAGAYLVSFNAAAYTSYGNETDGSNAPTSKTAASRYAAALNGLLERSSANRLPRPIGDSTVVFWADAEGVSEEAARGTENLFGGWFSPPAPDADDGKLARDEGEAAKLRDVLHDVAAGRPLKEIDPKLADGVRFHVLGLSPNAARLSVRFWIEDSFEIFAKRLAAHFSDLNIEPAPWRGSLPAVQWLLVKTTALREKFDNIPPLLAGEMMRAILTGAPYPRTLLAAAIIRLRAGDNPGTGWHAAVIKACINRTNKEKISVALEPDNPSVAYQLGRLFHVLESAQRTALNQVNASITEKYYSSASATPARIFGPLLRNLRHHVSDARKRGLGGWIEPKVTEIMSKLPSDLPKTLRLEDQGRFAVGYYHEKSSHWGKSQDTDKIGDEK